MRTIVAAVALLFAVSSQSQQPAPQPVPSMPAPLVEKIEVNVVNVDVTVTDRRGRPVRGLTRDEFEIREDSQPQHISNFSVVEDAAPVLSSDKESTPDRFRCKVLVLVDNLNTSIHSRNRALERLEQFVSAHFNDGHYDWSVATVDKRVHLLMPMTSSKAALHAVLREISQGVPHPELKRPSIRDEAPTNHFDPRTEISERSIRMVEAFVEENKNFDDESHIGEETMYAQASFQAIAESARSFASTEGRKMILLVTGNLPLSSSSPVDLVGASTISNHLVEVVRNSNALATMREILVREANASNTSFYIVSPEGLALEDQTPVNRLSMLKAPTGSLTVDTSAMYWLANQTGGAFLSGTHLDQSFAEFDRRSANYYALGYPTHRGADNHYHHISVSVPKHPEYRMQYRDGYSGASMDTQLNRSLRTTLGVSMQTSTLAMTLIVDPPQYRGLRAALPLKAAMKMESLQYITDSGGSHARLHVYVSVFDADGRNITLAKSLADIIIKPEESVTGPMTVTIPPLLLPKGSYRIVVAIRDELTDHVGMATSKIEV